MKFVKFSLMLVLLVLKNKISEFLLIKFLDFILFFFEIILSIDLFLVFFV